MSLSLLALNVGSASLKGASYSLTHKTPASETGRAEAEVASNAAVQAEASLAVVTAQLPALGAPALIVHRIVHGGDRPTPLELTPTLLDELTALASLYQKSLDYYAAHRDEADKLLGVGEYPRNKKHDTAELAAYATVMNVILNLDEVLCKE